MRATAITWAVSVVSFLAVGAALVLDKSLWSVGGGVIIGGEVALMVTAFVLAHRLDRWYRKENGGEDR